MLPESQKHLFPHFATEPYDFTTAPSPTTRPAIERAGVMEQMLRKFPDFTIAIAICQRVTS
jgi:hypothetical protein